MSNFIDPVKFTRSYLDEAGSRGIARPKDLSPEQPWFSPQDSSVPGDPPSLASFDRDVRKMLAESADAKQIEQYCGLSLLVASVSALNAAGAATGGPILIALASSLGKELISPEAKTKMGEEGLKYLMTSSGISTDPALNKRMNRICQKLLVASNLDSSSCQIHVLDSPEINAHSNPGHIIATRGLLEKLPNDDRLAFVLSHEMAHGENMDSVMDQGVSVLENLTVSKTMRKWKLPVEGGDNRVQDLRNQIKQVFYDDTLDYQREMELSADRRGIEIMFCAGFNPDEAINAIEDMHQGHSTAPGSSRFAVHPPREIRVNLAGKYIEELKRAGEETEK